MAFDGIYFYYIDNKACLLYAITSNGKKVYTFTIDFNLYLYDLYHLVYDGIGFWCLVKEKQTTYFYVIRLHLYRNQGIVSLDKFFLIDQPFVEDSSAFFVESYVTTLSEDCFISDNFIKVDAYFDKCIFTNNFVILGFNKEGFFDTLCVVKVVDDTLFFDNTLSYNYKKGDSVVIISSFFIFSNYNNGTLSRYSSMNGSLLLTSVSDQYKNVSAAMFTHIVDKLNFYKDIHTTLYVKGNILNLLSMDYLLGYSAATTFSDNFNALTLDLDKWSLVSGSYYMDGSNLILQTPITGLSSLRSNYYLLENINFEVKVSTPNYVNCSGISFYKFCIKLSEVYEHKNYEFGYIINEDTYSVGGRPYTLIDDQIYYFSSLSGVSYVFNIERFQNNAFLKVTSLEDSNFIEISLNDYALSMELLVEANVCSINATYIDYVTAISGVVTKNLDNVNYYGSITLDNLETIGNTIIPVKALAVFDDNIYRLQNKATFYGTTYDFGKYFNYQITPLRPYQDFISMHVYPTVLPATTHNYSTIDIVIKDQYTDGMIGQKVLVSDDDTIGYVTSSVVFTSYFDYSGKAQTAYTSGIEDRIVLIKAKVV